MTYLLEEKDTFVPNDKYKDLLEKTGSAAVATAVMELLIDSIGESTKKLFVEALRKAWTSKDKG